MDKKGPAGFPWCFASITKRYFVLDEVLGLFSYYKSEADALRGAPPRGSIDLRMVCCVRWSSDGTAPRHAIDLVLRKTKECEKPRPSSPPPDLLRKRGATSVKKKRRNSFASRMRAAKKADDEFEVGRIYTVVPLMSNRSFEAGGSPTHPLAEDARRAAQASPTFVGVTEDYAAHWCKRIVDALKTHASLSPTQLELSSEASGARLRPRC